MGLRYIEPMAIRRSIKSDDLRWVTHAGMLTVDNHEYEPIGRVSIAQAQRILSEEEEVFWDLEAQEFSLAAVEQVETELCEVGSEVVRFDLGTSATVHALKAVGCFPVYSCNGGCFGPGPHRLNDYPTILCYAKPRHDPRLLQAGEHSGVGIIL